MFLAVQLPVAGSYVGHYRHGGERHRQMSCSRPRRILFSALFALSTELLGCLARLDLQLRINFAPGLSTLLASQLVALWYQAAV